MSNRNPFALGARSVFGMVHCLPLPGTPKFDGNMTRIIDQALADARTLERAGVDALIVENMGDDPFGIELDTAQSTALAVVSALVKQQVSIPVGIDAALNDYRTSLSIAQAIGGDFVRLPVFVDTVDFYGVGTVAPCSRAAMYYRKAIGAENVRVFADVQVKHTHMVLSSVTIEDSARAARDCGADALIVTGSRIGVETPIELIQRVKKVVDIPVIAGSGVKTGNIAEQLSIADGAIVGSSLKEGGDISNPVSYELTRALIDARGEVH